MYLKSEQVHTDHKKSEKNRNVALLCNTNKMFLEFQCSYKIINHLSVKSDDFCVNHHTKPFITPKRFTTSILRGLRMVKTLKKSHNPL